MGFGNFAKGQISNAFMPTYGFVYGGKYRNAWVALPWKHFSPQKDLAAVVNDPTTDPHSADTIEFWAQFKPGSDGKGFGGAGGPKEFLKAYSAKDIAAYEVLASSTYGDTAKTLSSTVVVLYYKEGGSSTIDVQNYYYSAQNQRNAFRQANSALAMLLGFLNGVPRVGATAAQSGPAPEALATSPAPEAEEAVAQERIEEAPAEVLPQDTNDSSADTSTNALPQSTSENGVTAPSNALNALGRGLTIFAAVLGVGAVITDFFTYPNSSVQLIVFGIIRLVFFILMVIPFKKEWLSIVSRIGALGLILWLFISLAVFIPSIPSTRIETSYGTEFLMNEALFWVTFGLAAGAIVFSAISLIMYLVAKHKENNNH